jgi:hypothetical protein
VRRREFSGRRRVRRVVCGGELERVAVRPGTRGRRHASGGGADLVHERVYIDGRLVNYDKTNYS